MIKGDKIKLANPMGVFTNVGEICEVVNVDENGMISFRFGKNGMHLGCMSYNEFDKYFELVPESKHEWSEWKNERLFYKNLNGSHVSTTIRCRHNCKKVQVKYNCGNDVFIKAEASCHKEDEFDFEKGFKLAKCRLIVKMLNKEVEDFAKQM